MNREMLARFAPHLLRCKYPIGSDGCDGSGLRMGMGAGGNAINMHEGLMTTPFFPPNTHISGLLVNAQGSRFVNEDCYHGRVTDAILTKADGRAFLIVDDALYDEEKQFVPYPMAAVEETLEELEAALEIPEGELVHTVRAYNATAAKGEDPTFHKASKWVTPLDHPPYAALDLSVDNSIWAVFTLGGLDTKPTGEVLTVDGEVVRALRRRPPRPDSPDPAAITRAACRSAAAASLADGRTDRRGGAAGRRLNGPLRPRGSRTGGTRVLPR